MSEASQPLLEARGITVRFGGLTAVNEVDLVVPAGKIVGLIGPNGAGKSTLFDVLSGLRRPHSGSVSVDGEEVPLANPQALAARGMARTFQHPELFHGLTVRDHVTLSYRISRTPRRIWTDLLTGGGFRRPSAAETERVDSIVEGLNLTSIQYRPVLGLPLGLARLVELGRSIARDPRLLLLDEASSGLDVAETAELAGVLKAMVETRGVSLLMVEHDVELVLGMTDYVYVLDFGSLIAEGTPQEIRNNPAVRAAYLGEQLDQDAGSEPIDTAPIDTEVPA
jgi:branched-chain amino acid transport system ATP-binding protein